MPARTLALVLLALPIGAPVGAQPSPQARVWHCASHAPATLRGMNAVRAACPGIGRAVAGLGLTALLPAHWRQTLTPHALADLGALARRYGGPPLSPLPDATALHAIALTLKPPLQSPPSSSSWWTRFKTWMGHWTATLRRMITHWLRSLERATGESSALGALFVVGGLLLLTVAVVVFFELRAAGLIGPRHRRAHRHRAPGDAGMPPEEATTTAGPDWNELREHPAQLLRLLVEALVRSRRIKHERHLTCREILTRARFDTASQQQEFSHVAMLAERELYGPDATEPLPDETLRAAKTLHADLLTSPARLKASSS